jgi:hypothetical protein
VQEGLTMTIRFASFNVENLFSRPNALNQLTWADGQLILAAFAEFNALTGCVQAGETAATSVSLSIWARADYILPAVFRLSPDLRAGLFELVGEAAAADTPQLVEAREGCRADRPQRWHTALGRARTAYLAYLDARLDVDRAIARDGSQVYVQHPELADDASVHRVDLRSERTVAYSLDEIALAARNHLEIR